jgi:hypothetical protein
VKTSKIRFIPSRLRKNWVEQENSVLDYFICAFELFSRDFAWCGTLKMSIAAPCRDTTTRTD